MDNQNPNPSLNDFYAYVEPMGHGEHFVALVHPSSVMAGMTQFDRLGENGTIVGTEWWGQGALFHVRVISEETAIAFALKMKRQMFHVFELPAMLIPAKISATETRPEQPDAREELDANEESEEECEYENDRVEYPF